jgi:hypothetical protein
MANPFDEFDAVETQASQGNPFDAFDGAVEEPKADTSATSILKDVARLFVSPATMGFNAIGTAIGQGMAGGNVTDALIEGAQSDEFLGAKLSMDSEYGKKAEEWLGEKLTTVRNKAGDLGVEALTNKGVRALLKGFPQSGLVLEAYDMASPEVKTKVEALVYAGTSAAPEIALTLLGGSKANKALSKKASTLTEDDILKTIEPEAEVGRQKEMTPIEFESGLAIDDTPTPKQDATNPFDYEGGVDFYGEPEPKGSRLTPEPEGGLELMPKVGDLGLELVDDNLGKGLKELASNLELEPIETTAKAIKDNSINFEKVDPNSLKETQQSLNLDVDDGMEFRTNATPEQGASFIERTLTDMTNPNKGEPAQMDLAGINKPAGQTGFGKSQRGSVSLFSKKELTPEQKAKKLNLAEFTQDFVQRHPQYKNRPEVAQQVYQRLNNPIEASPSISQAVKNSETLKALDYGVGIMSTRVDNINQGVMHRLMRYEKDLLKQTFTKIGKVDTFLDDLNKLPKNTQALMNSLLLNNKTDAIKSLAESTGRKDLVGKYEQVRNVLREVGADLKSIGRIDVLRDDYFPRMVKDVEGLKATLGGTVKDALEVRLNEARTTAMKNGQAFGPIQESQIIDSFLRGNTTLRNKPGFTKERKIDDVAPDLERFYHTPTETLHTYLRNAIQEVETARLFGKDAVRDRNNGRIDVDASIGTLVQNKLRSGEINGKQARELESILRSRMGPGNMTSNPVLQDFKNLANMGLLGNVFSALTQAGDVFASTYLNGFKPTLIALSHMAKGNNKISMKDFGLIDHVSEEFVSSRSTAKALNRVFKLSGFADIDKLGKTTILNSALLRGQNMVKTPKGVAKLKSQWGARFGDEFPQLVKDLQEGKVTELTDMYAFSTLAKVQPITKMELPQMYADLPNGRVIYMLKSFMLKQIDLYRNDAFNKIFKEGKKKEGLSNLARLTMTLGIAGASTEWVKDYLMSFIDGREVQDDPKEFLTSDVPMNVLKTFGWSEYTIDKFKTGAVGESLGGIVLPPFAIFDDLTKDSIAEMDGDDETESSQRSLNFIPVVGKLFYQLSEKGQEARERRLERKEDKE